MAGNPTTLDRHPATGTHDALPVAQSDTSVPQCGSRRLSAWPLVRFIQHHEVLYVAVMCGLAAIILATYCTWLWSKGNAHNEGDQLDYRFLALGILRQGSYLHCFRPPLYPFVLGLSYAVFGVNQFAGLSLQCVLGVSSCLVLHLLARDLLGQLVAAVALVVSVVYYYYFKQCGFYMSEPLYSVLLGCAALMGLRATQRQSLRLCLLFGAVLGLSALARPTSLALVLPAVLYPMVAERGAWVRQRLVHAIAVVLGFSLVVGPWTLRNWSCYHSVIPVSANAGMTLVGSNNPVILRSRCLAAAWVNPQDTELLAKETVAAMANEVELSKVCFRATLEYPAARPDVLVPLAFWKFIRFWHLIPLASDMKPIRFLAWLQYCCVLVFAIYGARCCLPDWRRHFFVYATLFTFCTVGIVFNPDQRIRLPIEQFLVLFAAVGACNVLARLSRTSNESQVAAALRQQGCHEVAR